MHARDPAFRVRDEDRPVIADPGVVDGNGEDLGYIAQALPNAGSIGWIDDQRDRFEWRARPPPPRREIPPALARLRAAT
jgi:hypothetical protein